MKFVYYIFIFLVLYSCTSSPSTRPPEKKNQDSIQPLESETHQEIRKPAGAGTAGELAVHYFEALKSGDFDNEILPFIPGPQELEMHYAENGKTDDTDDTELNMEAGQVLNHLKDDFSAARRNGSEAGVNWQVATLKTKKAEAVSGDSVDFSRVVLIVESGDKKYKFIVLCLRISEKWYFSQDFKFKRDMEPGEGLLLEQKQKKKESGIPTGKAKRKNKKTKPKE